jgi:hypothetical protein
VIKHKPHGVAPVKVEVVSNASEPLGELVCGAFSKKGGPE